ncbi:MAG: hypothetical protein ACK5O3_13935 [Burkholderiales bacterium]
MPLLYSNRRRQGSPARRGQRGNAVVFAVMALIILALVAITQLEASTVRQRSEAGIAEATVMEAVASATNNMVFEFFPVIQTGGAITKFATTVTPVLIAGELVWRPTIPELVAMGYLPAGWVATTSNLTDGAYTMEFTRLPAGCPIGTCNVEGIVVNRAPVLAEFQAGTNDSRAIGPFLAKVGNDAGVSLPGSSAQISGFGNTWNAPNPVAGTPAGVLAIRIGQGTSGWSQFVRIGDFRDPALNGNLTVAGNGAFGGTLSVAGATTLNGATTINAATTINNAPLNIRNGAATCVELLPVGQVRINCAGLLNANTGIFADGLGNESRITPTEIVATGRVRAGDGFEGAGGNTAFTRADPNAIRVAAGDLFVRGGAGTLLRITTDGDVVATRDNIATNNVAGQRVSLREQVVEDAPCVATSGPLAAGTEVASLNTGGLALCRAGRWTALNRQATENGACTKPGATATADGSGTSLICRGGRWVPTTLMLSNFLLVGTQSVSNGSAVAKPSCPSPNAEPVQALIILVPASDEIPFDPVTGSLGAIARYATDNGASWSVALTSGSGVPMASASALAHTYCWYPALSPL